MIIHILPFGKTIIGKSHDVAVKSEAPFSHVYFCIRVFFHFYIFCNLQPFLALLGPRIFPTIFRSSFFRFSTSDFLSVEGLTAIQRR